MASVVRMGDVVPVARHRSGRQQDFAGRLEDSIERGANHPLSLQYEEGYRRGGNRLHLELTTSIICLFWAAEPQRIAKLANYIRRRQIAGRWMEYLSRWAVGAECNVQGLFCPETCGRFAGRCAMSDSETVHRLGGLAYEFLRAFLSGAGGRTRLGNGAGHSAGADASAELVLHQYLRDVVVDSRNCDSDGDSFGVAAGLAIAGAGAGGRAV